MIAEKHIPEGRRLRPIFFLCGVLLLILAITLSYRQLYQSSEYRELERKQAHRRILRPGPRGDVLDRDGRLLIGNRAHYSAVIKLELLRQEIKLEKIKLELQKEKDKATKELAEGEDEEEDLREVDYLQKLITLSVKFDHHIGMFLMPAYIDCGLKYDNRLAESYTVQITTIQSFLRLLEKVDGVTREEVTKQCILNLRNIIQLVFKNMVKPLYREVGLMKKKPKSESLDNFKQNWNERLDELQKTCDFEYQILDVKGFLIK